MGADRAKRARRLARKAKRRESDGPWAVACVPVDTSRLPNGMNPPVPSIEHSVIQCPQCGQDCWIGPVQAEMVKLGSPVLCYYCLIASAAESGALIAVHSLNSRADDTGDWVAVGGLPP